MKEELEKALQAIADGYEYKISKDKIYDMYWIRVENPTFREDNGENPYLVFTVKGLTDGVSN